MYGYILAGYKQNQLMLIKLITQTSKRSVNGNQSVEKQGFKIVSQFLIVNYGPKI